MEQEIDFKPRDVDIVSTKLRTWNLKHPGNVFYTELIQKMLPEVQNEDQAEYRRVAEQAVEILTVQRNGRFLKLREGDKEHTRCIVMDHRHSVNKAIHALRTAAARLEGTRIPGSGRPPGSTSSNNNSSSASKSSGKGKGSSNVASTPPPAKKKKTKDAKSAKSSKSSRARDKVKDPWKDAVSGVGNSSIEKNSIIFNNNSYSNSSINNNSSRIINHDNSNNIIINNNHSSAKKGGKSQQKLVYTVEEGNQPLGSYLVSLITLVCNQTTNPKVAFQVLDKPGLGYTFENEPEKNRLIRLQLRHRYASGVLAGMSPLEFSQRLLSNWGGKLIDERRRCKSGGSNNKESSKRKFDNISMGNGDDNENDTSATVPTEQEQQQQQQQQQEEEGTVSNNNTIHGNGPLQMETATAPTMTAPTTMTMTTTPMVGTVPSMPSGDHNEDNNMDYNDQKQMHSSNTYSKSVVNNELREDFDVNIDEIPSPRATSKSESDFLQMIQHGPTNIQTTIEGNDGNDGDENENNGNDENNNGEYEAGDVDTNHAALLEPRRFFLDSLSTMQNIPESEADVDVGPF